MLNPGLLPPALAKRLPRAGGGGMQGSGGDPPLLCRTPTPTLCPTKPQLPACSECACSETWGDEDGECAEPGHLSAY